MENAPNNNNKKQNSLRRKLRYRNLLTQLQELQESEDLGLNTVNQLGYIFKEVDLVDGECEFENRVEYTDETLLDTAVVSNASGILVKCINNLELCSATYEPTEFASKTIHEIKESNEDEVQITDWLKLLEKAREIVPELPNYSFLYGSYDPTKLPEPKFKKARTKQDQETVEKKQLERVEKVSKNDEENVEDTVKFLVYVLSVEYEKKNYQPVFYFDFVVDSNSFSSTVENMFYTSFLVRDGRARLDINEDGIPTLKPMSKSDLKEFRNTGGVNLQRIPSITMDDWTHFKSRQGFLQKHKKSKGNSTN